MNSRTSIYLTMALATLGLAACDGGWHGPYNPPPPPPPPGGSISVTFASAPPSTLVAGATASLTATVVNDTANAGVTWTLRCALTQCGSVSPASTASGTPTIFTAPTSFPPIATPLTVTVIATSVTNTGQTAATTITVTPTAQPVTPILGNGTYVYHLAGQDANGPYFVAGAFTVSNGAITGGEQDFTDGGGIATDTLVTSGSSISQVGDKIQIVINTGDSSIGVNGVETLRGTVGMNTYVLPLPGGTFSSLRVLVSEYDASAVGTGSVDIQTGATAPAGGYAFYVSGQDGSAFANAIGIGGILNVGGTALNVSGSVFDLNDGGNTVLQNQTFASGAVTLPDSYGRVAFTLVPNSTSGVPSFILTGYIIGNAIQLIESQPDNLNATTGGMALGQGVNTGAFTSSGPSVAGISYAFGASGEDANGFLQLAGSFALNSNGSVSGTVALNDIVSSFSSPISSGSYTVASNGRVTITNVSSSLIPNPLSFQLYLDGNGNALELGVDNIQVSGGVAYAQTAPSPALASVFAFSGQGFWSSNVNNPAWSAAGPVTVWNGSVYGDTDYSLQNPNASVTLTPNVSLSGTANSSTGAMALNGLNATAFQNSGSYAYFAIDATQAIALEIDGTQTGQMGLLTLEFAP
jgi:hypothetical protein